MAVPKFERPENRGEYLYQYWRVAGRILRSAGLFVGVTIANWTVAELEKRRFKRKLARGEKIWIDDIPKPPGAETQQIEGLRHVEADMTPRSELPKRKSRFLKAKSYPEPDYPFAYREPPTSGMVITGLGETEKRRPHSLFFGLEYPWGGLFQVFFILGVPWSVKKTVLRIFWEDWRRVGAVARERQPVTDPVEMSEKIKATAKECGAALVGITEPTDEMFFEEFDQSYKYAISVAVPMDREEMSYTPSERSHLEVFRIYREVGQVAINLAAQIRALGYPARACTNIVPDAEEVLHIPVAVKAGLGELGKHNSMITKDHGANVRLATVLTDLPLVPDEPIDIGVNDFCMSCQICTTNCPPQAIFEEKQMVRGEERWFVNFDRCVPYFSSNETCGICIEVCPWSEPGRGEVLMNKMLARREKKDAS
ncbi:MAG: 4Fe-4S dicluster domain-containing protein [Rubrobacteraceae bacterium]